MKKTIFWVFILSWIIGSTYTVAHIHGIHLIEFDNAKVNKTLKLKIETPWGLTHILAEECGCSETVLEYLVKRGPQKNVSESVILLGQSLKYKDLLSKKGFKIIDGKYLDGYVDGVPMLVIHNKSGEVKYSGGYTKGMVTPISKILDLKILEQVKNNINSKDLVVMGCAISKELQKEIDPLGLKYN